ARPGTAGKAGLQAPPCPRRAKGVIMRHRRIASGVLVALAWLGGAGTASAEITVPRGFTVSLYASGDGFDAGSISGAGGFPTTTTAAFDAAGMLYLARTGRRYTGGEVDDLWPVYRVPP